MLAAWVGDCGAGGTTCRASTWARPGGGAPGAALQGAGETTIKGRSRRKVGDAIQAVKESAAALVMVVDELSALAVDEAVGAGTSSVTCGDRGAVLATRRGDDVRWWRRDARVVVVASVVGVERGPRKRRREAGDRKSVV